MIEGIKYSVIISTHNRFNYMIEAAKSALSQDPQPAEICIVDDGSSTPVLTQWAEENPIETSINIKFTRINDEGPAAARNAGTAIASGDYLVFLDDDDQFLPNYTKTAFEKLRREKADVCVSWLRCFNSEKEWPGKHFPTNHLECDPYERNIGFVGSNIIVAADLYTKIGGFDGTLLGSEDKDFYIRLREASARIVVLEEEMIRYRVHASEQASGQYRFHPFQVSGKYLFLKKHGHKMSPKTFRKLAGDAGFFRMMGGKGLSIRLDGLWHVIRYDFCKLFIAMLLTLRK